MSKVVFSSWAGSVVDNRKRGSRKSAGMEIQGIPLKQDGYKVRALMSWNGLVVADAKVNIVDMACSYIKEVQKLSCGECTVGYIGMKVLADIMGRIAKGKGVKKDIAAIQRLSNGIRDNSKCEFCSSAVVPLLDTVKYYRDEYIGVIASKKAPAKTAYTARVTAPCVEACPAHQDIPGYIELIRNRRYTEALELIRKTNCLPGVTGRACFAFCESKCTRRDIDEPLAIRALKRFPADYEYAGEIKHTFKKAASGKQRVAVIGAGPAGLAAANNLTLKGYKVTIYDEQSAEGGMVLVGIPAYRLPDDILKSDIEKIKRLGIDVKLDTRLGRDITLEQLSQKGFKAVFIATGAHLSRGFDIENWKANSEGIADGIEFLRRIKSGEKVKPKDKVIIIGGGNVAIDCACNCLRLGCKDVTIIYRRSRAEMPARKEEVEEAEKEGVKFDFLVTPVKVVMDKGKVTGAECIKMKLGEPDASGRRRPIPIKGSEYIVKTDMIISAIGEMPDLSFAAGGGEINVTEQGTIAADAFTCKTETPWVFSGGDCVTGPASIIEAIAAGNRAALSIERYLQSGEVSLSKDNIAEILLRNVGLGQQRKGIIATGSSRQLPEQLPLNERKNNFSEIEKCFTTEVAIKEAERCLRCYRVMLMAITGGK